MIQTFKKLFFLLAPNEIRSLGLLLIMITTSALFDMIGVASILPFVAVLTNPSLIETNYILKILFQVSAKLGIENIQEFLFALGVLVLILLILSITIKAITTYLQVQFVQMREASIGKKLVEGYLNHPYSWFLSRNSAELGKNILSEVSQVVSNGLQPFIEFIAKCILVITLITLLIVIDPKLAIIVGITLSFAYVIIFYFVRKFLSEIGKKRLINNKLRFKVVLEAFGAIKEIKIRGLERTFTKRFSNFSKIYATTIATSQAVSQLPRFILEAISFGGILLIILYMLGQTGNFNNSIPIISLYVFTGYRLMPALQQIYSAFTQITFAVSSIDKLYIDFKEFNITKKIQDQDILKFNKSIDLNKIYYNYPNTTKATLTDINLTIPSKSIVGFIGPTGSGKTTTIDLILGILQPQKGSLEVDEKTITKQNVKAWQKIIGYVPQNIFLSDDTIAANIAFGVRPEDIDQNMLYKASKIANLHKFVINELPQQYQTIIGERGVKLSGGQCQRIGIARALYFSPKVLILDEATSALDNQTEQAVMDAVNNLSKELTIILIAHRLSSLKKCDKVFLINKGKLEKEGTFEELINMEEIYK